MLIVIFGYAFCNGLAAGNLSQQNKADTLLVKGRKLFHKSVENKKPLDEAISLFKELKTQPRLTALAQTYIGALEALKGKHATFPHQKLKWVKRGLKKMDQGVSEAPDDIEVRFVRASTCFHLPFFFGRKEQAQNDFKHIVQLLPDHFEKYPTTLIMNVIAFIEENYSLTNPESNKLIRVKKQIETYEN